MLLRLATTIGLVTAVAGSVLLAWTTDSSFETLAATATATATAAADLRDTPSLDVADQTASPLARDGQVGTSPPR